MVAEDDQAILAGYFDIASLALALVILIVVTAMVLVFQAKMTALRSSRLMASTVGGAVAALASNPNSGTYCIGLSGNTEYTIIIAPGWVAAWDPNTQVAGLTFIPVHNLPRYEFTMPAGRSYTLTMRKYLPDMVDDETWPDYEDVLDDSNDLEDYTLIKADAVTGEPSKAHCDVVIWSES